jgi:flagellar hook protein FlgE
MRVTATAASGLRSAMARFESNAATIAGSGLTDRPVTEAGAVTPVADVTDALESMMEAGLSYRANGAVLRTNDQMIGSLIDRSA